MKLLSAVFYCFFTIFSIFFLFPLQVTEVGVLWLRSSKVIWCSGALSRHWCKGRRKGLCVDVVLKVPR